MEELMSDDGQGSAAIRIGDTHGYRIEADTASLNVELSIEEPWLLTEESWALQLWACDAAYEGGQLSGIKIAEAPIELGSDSASHSERFSANAFAHLPVGGNDYAMVLVLVSGKAGAFHRVWDYANYPARERFLAPRLDGSVGYRVTDDGQVVLSVERVVNPRDAWNLSGTLSLELWALDQPWVSGPPEGEQLAVASLDRLTGQCSQFNVEYAVPFREPAPGSKLTLLLREWTSQGYLTRDRCNFSERWYPPVAVTVAAEEASAAVEKDHLASLEAEKAAAPDAATPATLPAEAPAKVDAEVPAAKTPETSTRDAAASPAGPAKSRRKARTETPSGKSAAAKDTPKLLSVNKATADELAAVKGLNAKLAKAIVKERPFKTIDELTRVRGLGVKSLQALRASLTV
jgi:competence ComEA-like helix-hairpin-helix protein